MSVERGEFLSPGEFGVGVLDVVVRCGLVFTLYLTTVVWTFLGRHMFVFVSSRYFVIKVEDLRKGEHL